MLTFFSKILVAYDGSELAEKALKAAMKLAMQDKKIELHIVYVLNPLPFLDSRHAGSEQVKALRREKAEHLAGELKQSLQGMGNPITVCLMEGYPGRRIVEYAAKNQMNLIVMGSRGLGALKELFLGSVSHYVVQHSSVPTFILK